MSFLVQNNSQKNSIPLAINMVNGDTVELIRIGGTIYFEFIDSSNNILWQATANGGIPTLSNGYIGYAYDPKINYNFQPVRGCTITFNTINDYTIITTGGVNEYNILFSPYPGIPFKFTQTVGPATIGVLNMNYYTC